MSAPFAALPPAAVSHESHEAPLLSGKGLSWWPMMLVAALLFATTAAAAVMATSTTTPSPALWKQDPPSTFNKGPEGAEYRALLF